MMNFEKHKERIKEIVSSGNDLAVRNGEPGICRLNAGGCDYCDLDKEGETCSLTTLQWLLEDDGTPSAERLAGQREAWELARKIGVYESKGGYSGKQLNEIFDPHWTVNSIMANNSYAEAAEKVKACEDRNKIKNGQVWVAKRSGVEHLKIIVTCTSKNNAYILHGDGSTSQYCVKDFLDTFAYTGRTLPVEDWLRQIGGEG